MSTPCGSPPRRGRRRRTSRWLLGIGLVLALGVWVVTLKSRGGNPLNLWTGRVPGGVGLLLVGMTASGDDAISELLTEIRRFRDDERDADFATDRADELGELYEAVGDLAADLDACRDERDAGRERVRETAGRIDRYRPLVESAGDPMAVLDAEGRFEVLNEAMAEFHGTEREGLLGTDARELVADEGVEAIENAQRRLLADSDRRWEQVEVTMQDAMGTERRFEANVGVLRDEDGNFDGSVLTYRDVSERVEAEAELREREQDLVETRDRLQQHNQAVGRLYEIGADVDLTLGEKIQQVLDLGREYLEVDGAFLSTIDQEDDHFEFVYTSGTGPGLSPGTVAPFSETYCRKTLDTDEVYEVSEASAEGWTDDPAFVRWGFERYVGGKVFVEGELEGTLGFVDEDAAASMSDEQRTFVDLARQWLGYELERNRREQRLQRYREYTDDVLDAIDDVFYVLDDEGNLRRWNRSLSRETGYEDDEIEGTHALEFFAEEDHETIATAIEEVFESGSVRVEAPFLTKTGERVPYEFIATKLSDPDGNEILAGIGRDISERKERERELRETNERLEAVVEASPAALIALDDEGKVTLWNPAAERIFGWSEAELLGEALPTTPTEELAEDHESLFERVMDGETVTGIETTRQRKDGELIDVSLSIAPIRDAEGTIVGTMGALTDVTERKERERALRETNERLNAIVEASPDALIALDRDGTVELWNPAAEEIFGWSAEEVVGGALPFIPEDRDHEFAEYHKRLLEGEQLTGIETKRRTKDGRLVNVNFSAAPLQEDGEVVGIMGILEDISERKAYERELERTTALLSRAEEMAAVGGWSVDVVDGQPRNPTWSEKLYDIFELPQHQTPPTEEVFAYYHPDDRERHREALQRAIETGERWDQELRMETAEGTERWVRNIGEPVVEDGDVVRLTGSIQDITERKEREQELREREQRLEEYKEYTDDILDAIDDVFYVIDDEGNFLRWNESARGVAGYDDEEIAALNALELFPEEHHERILEALETVFDEPGSRRVEAPICTKEGEEIPYEFVASTVEDPDGEEVLVGIGRDITDRKRREAALERATELLEQAQQIATVGGWEYDVQAEEMTVTDEFRRLHDIDPDVDVGIDDVVSAYHPDDREHIEETFETAIESGEGYDMEVRLRSDEVEVRWVRALAEPVRVDGEVVALRGSIQDITEAKEREQAIRTLHDAAQGLLQTETDADVSELVVETAADVLDVSGVCLYLLDEEGTRLVPEACTDGFEELTGGAPPIAVGEEDDPVWNSFATGSRRVFDDTEEEGGQGLFSRAVGGGLVVPVGDHGVLVVTTAQSTVSVRTRQLVETLVATTEAALDRLESEANLRERDVELEARNRRLRRQIQLTDVIRRVDRSLVGTNSHEEIERAVCEELSDSEDIAFAWIGSLDATDERLVPRTWAGGGDAYLDAVDLGAGSAEPAARTAQSDEPTVASNVLSDLSGEAWRKTAVDAGFRSVLAVPIAFEDYRHGVLAVYADETEAFGDLERTVFTELGQTIANAINAVQTREALHADTLLELTLEIEAPETFLAQLARRADCPVEYVGIGSQSGDETSVFFATTAERDVEAALAEMVTVTESRLLSEREGRRVFEATVSGPVLPAKLLRHGAQPGSIEATPEGVSVVVSVPTSTDVREFVEMLRESYPAVELAGRRNVTRATRTRQEMVGDLLEELTDRQLEVLRTAYYAGYFDWPRGSSGEEIAELLDVTQPTVSRHLRLGQRQLLGQLLAEEPATVTAS